MTHASNRLTPLLPLAVLLIGGVVTGCHNNDEMPAPNPSVNVPNARLKIAMQTAPAAIRQMDPTAFTIRLSDARGHPIDGASVTTDLVMPAMDMGRNTVVVHPQGVGVYTGTGRFSMGGDWNVVVKASHGAEKAIQTFPVRVR